MNLARRQTSGPVLFPRQEWAPVVGVGACVLLLIELFIDPAHLFSSWLFAWLFWLGISLGSLAMIMLFHTTGGLWGLGTRRIGEAAALTLPLLLLLFIPIALGLKFLYPWASPAAAADPVLVHRRIMMNGGFFVLRAVIYLAIWIALAFSLRGLSVRHDASGDPALSKRMASISSAGLLLYFLTITFAGFDWVMSREAHWYSSIFGFLMATGEAVSGLAFMVLAYSRLSLEEPLKAAVRPNWLNDLGNLLLTCVILWAYMSFVQFLVSWDGNKQSEAVWYVKRTSHGWEYVGFALIVLHFFVPFFLLLSQRNKRRIERLGAIAGWVLFIHAVEVFYLVAPSAPQEYPGRGFGWSDVVAPVAIGGLWLAVFNWNLARQPLLPLGARVPLSTVDHGPQPATSPVG